MNVLDEGGKICLHCLYYPMCKEIAAGNCTLASEACEVFEPDRRRIPVTERLPEDPDMYVLVVCSGMYQGIGFEDAYELATYSPGEGWMLELYPDARVTVTHWMPLPEPPEVIEEAEGEEDGE